MPRIKSLSPSGVLYIDWDKQLKKPENLSKLPETYIVVTDEAEAEKVLKRRDGRRRLKKTVEWF